MSHMSPPSTSKPSADLMQSIGLPHELIHDFEEALLEVLPDDFLAVLTEDDTLQERRRDAAADVYDDLPSHGGRPISIVDYWHQGRQLTLRGMQQSCATPEKAEVLKENQVSAFALSFLASTLASVLLSNITGYLRVRFSPVTREHLEASLCRLVLPLESAGRSPQERIGGTGVKLVVVPLQRSADLSWSHYYPLTPHTFVTTEGIHPPPSDGDRLLLEIDGDFSVYLEFGRELPTEFGKDRVLRIQAKRIDLKQKRGKEREQVLRERYLNVLCTALRWVLNQEVERQPWWQWPQQVLSIPRLHAGAASSGFNSLRTALTHFLLCLQRTIIPEDQGKSCIASIMMPSPDGATLETAVETSGFPPSAREPIILYGPRGVNKITWGLTGRAYVRRQLLISRDAQSDPRVLDARTEKVHQAIAAPVVIGRTFLSSQDLKAVYMDDLETWPPAGSQHYHDYGVIYIGLVGSDKAFAPEHVVFVRHMAMLLAELLAYADARSKREELIWNTIDMSYSSMLSWVDPDYFWANGDFVRTVNQWVLEHVQGSTKPDLAAVSTVPARQRGWTSFVLVSIDQKETLFRDLGGDFEIAIAYTGLRDLVDRVLDKCSYHAVMSDYQHDVLVALDDCALFDAWQITDEIRKRQNLGAELSLVQFGRRYLKAPITISGMIWTCPTSQLADLGFGTLTETKKHEALVALNLVLRRLKKTYEGCKEVRREDLRDPYVAVAEIFWIDPAAPERVRMDHPQLALDDNRAERANAETAQDASS